MSEKQNLFEIETIIKVEQSTFFVRNTSFNQKESNGAKKTYFSLENSAQTVMRL